MDGLELLLGVVLLAASVALFLFVETRSGRQSDRARYVMEAYLSFAVATLVALAFSIERSRSLVRNELDSLRIEIRQSAVLSGYQSTRAITHQLVRTEEQRGHALDTINGRRILEAISNFENGFAVIELFDQTMLLANQMIMQARDTILATSYVLPDSFWLRPETGDYGTRDGVVVRRVFIIGDSTECSKLRAKVEWMRQGRVDVRFIAASGRSSTQLRDFIIQDRGRAMEMVLSERRFAGARYYEGGEMVASLQQLFEALYRSGKDGCLAALGQGG